MAQGEYFPSPHVPLVCLAIPRTMTFCSLAKIYGAQALSAADQAPLQASNLSEADLAAAAAAATASGFPGGFEFADATENAGSWSSQPVNAPDAPDPSQPENHYASEDPWTPLQTRGERTHSCEASMMQMALYAPSGALSESGTLRSRHAFSDSAYVSRNSASRQLDPAKSKSGKAVGKKGMPPSRPMEFRCEWQNCGNVSKCPSDFGYVTAAA